MDRMTPEHPLWDDFLLRLEGPEGCNFVEQRPGDPSSITWQCSNGEDRPFATAILEDMRLEGVPIDIQESLDYMRECGGHCDCEIVFNVRN